MAIYHAHTQPIARRAGRSAVAAAAYRTGCELTDERTGQVHDYTRKRNVVSAEVITPDGSLVERAALWNAAEAAEKRQDARTAREWVIALPAELEASERAELARAFGAELARRYGVAVDVAIHRPDRAGDTRNHHAHLLTTTRQVQRDASGALVLGDKTTLELSDTARRGRGLGAAADEVTALRQLWEQMANRALERAGRAERIDARSLKAQGLDREATTHLGPVAIAMERRGVRSDRGDGNRQVQARNAQRGRLQAQILDLQAKRQRRAQARREAAERVERERLERMTAAELREEIERRRPPPVRDVVERHPEVVAAREARDVLADQWRRANAAAAQADREMEDWRSAHPRRAGLHDAGLMRVKFLAEREPIKQASETAALWLAPRLEAATAQAQAVEARVWARIEREQAPVLARVAELERLERQKAAQELEQKRRAQALDKVLSVFKSCALKREMKAHGYGDTGKQWNALPEPLRQTLDEFNRLPKAARSVLLERMRQVLECDPAAVERLVQQLNRGKERGRDHGLGR